MDALQDMAAFTADVHAAIFSIGVQPSVEALAAYWRELQARNRAVAADARVIAAKNRRKQELGAA